MLSRLIKTLAGGALGAIALYTVGKTAYVAGQEIAREECRLEAMREELRRLPEAEKREERDAAQDDVEEARHIPVQPEHHDEPPRKKGMGRIFGGRGKGSVIRSLIRQPEQHALEAFVEDDQVKISIRRRNER